MAHPSYSAKLPFGTIGSGGTAQKNLSQGSGVNANMISSMTLNPTVRVDGDSGAIGELIVDPNRSIRPPKAYNPKKDGDFKIWVRHLEHYFSLLKVADVRKTTVLLYYLGEEASNTAFYLGITDATNFEQAKNVLMLYFSPVETPEELRTKFHQRYQGPDESLEHFAMELRVLCSKAYKNMNANELEEMAKQQFIMGVRNNAAREKLIVHRPANLKDAIEYGRLLEVASKTVRGCFGSGVKPIFATLPADENSQAEAELIPESEYQIDQESDSLNENQCISQGNEIGFDQVSSESNTTLSHTRLGQIICFYCGKPGHKAINCYQKFTDTVRRWPKGYSTESNWDSSNMIVESDEEDSDDSDF